MKKNSRPVGRKDDIVVQELDGEVLIYDLRNNKAFCLNPTSATIWKLCDGDNSVSEIASHFVAGKDSSNGEDLVWLALDQLKRERLLESGIDTDHDPFKGLTRREVVKKVGLGSMIALPFVLGITAPLAVHANSACMTVLMGCSCGTGDNQPAGMFCTPSGTFSQACTDMNCRCLSNGTSLTPNDDCVP